MPERDRGISPKGAVFASWPRRIAAFLADQIVAVLSTIAVIGPNAYSTGERTQVLALGVYIVEVAVMTAFAAASFGQLLTGIRVLRLDGRPLTLLTATVRTLLICLVVPPLVFRSDSGRGLHDLAVGSAAFGR